MAKYGNKNTLDYTALTRELKRSGPGNLYMFWGPEDYLITDYVNRLRKSCLSEGMGDFNVKRLDGPELDVQAVEEALNAMPFFGSRTFVELRGFDVNKCRNERMQRLLEDIPAWCTVVITLPPGGTPDGRLGLVKAIKRRGQAVEFTPQGQVMLYQWLQRRFAFHNKTVDRPTMDRLMFLSGELMNRLIPEVDKICAYTAGDVVTVADVEAVAHHIPEADAFRMTDCIAAGDYDGAAGYLGELLAGDREPMEVLGTIGWQMRQLYAARVALDTGRGPAFAQEVLGIGNEYRLRKLMDTAQRFTLKALTNDVRYVAELCMRTREQGGVLTDTEALKELLIRFAMESRHA